MDSRKPEMQASIGMANLPNDLKRLLFKGLNEIDGFNLYWASPRLFRFSYSPLRKLLSHAALGEWDNARPLYTTLPFLLTCRGTVYHPNRVYQEGQAPVTIPPEMNPGRYKYVNCTAWQIALMNEEYEIAEEMGKLMTEKEKREQFKEIFPDGKMVKYYWDLKEALKRLQDVFSEVIKDPSIAENNLDNMSASTRKALYALYAYVKPAPEHRVGLVFDANLYVDALKLYEERFNQFQNWDQRSFWCVRIEEHLASLLGTGYLRPHAQGIWNNLRRTGCILADNSSYFAFRRTLNSIPASHFFVGGWRRRPMRRRGPDGVPRFFKTYVEQKREQGQNLCDNIRARPKRKRHA
jgi:hypothetical protein